MNIKFRNGIINNSFILIHTLLFVHCDLDDEDEEETPFYIYII